MPRSGGGQSGESFWKHLKKAITYQWGWKLMSEEYNSSVC